MLVGGEEETMQCVVEEIIGMSLTQMINAACLEDDDIMADGGDEETTQIVVKVGASSAWFGLAIDMAEQAFHFFISSRLKLATWCQTAQAPFSSSLRLARLPISKISFARW